MSIQRIIEIPLREIQTEKAKKIDITTSSCCCICGKPIKERQPVKMVHLMENGNIISYNGSDIEGSQGFFPVGKECEKKLVIKFAF